MRQLLDAGVEVFATQGLPRRPRRRHREARRRPRTAPSTCTSPTRKSCSARSRPRSPTRCRRSPSARAARRRAPTGRAALQRWIARFADLYEHYGAGHPGLDRGRDRRQRVRPARHRRAHPVHARARPSASPRSRRPTSIPTIAALALVAMLERLNYYVLAGQVRVDRDDDGRHARPRHARRAVRRLDGVRRRGGHGVAAEDPGLEVAELATPGPSTRPRP